MYYLRNMLEVVFYVLTNTPNADWLRVPLSYTAFDMSALLSKLADMDTADTVYIVAWTDGVVSDIDYWTRSDWYLGRSGAFGSWSDILHKDDIKSAGFYCVTIDPDTELYAVMQLDAISEA